MLQAIDESILLFIQTHIRCAPLDFVMRFFSVIGNTGLCWIVLGAVLLLYKKTRRAGFDMLLCLAIAWMTNDLVVKNLAARPRPYDVIEGLTVLVGRLASYSFPSGHASSSFAAATALCIAFRGKGGAWFYLPAALIAVSRVYVGMHYLTDVVCGAALGTVVSYAVYRVEHRLIPERFLDPAA